MKFLIVEPSPLPILIPLGLNIHLRILFSNTISLHYSLTDSYHLQTELLFDFDKDISNLFLQLWYSRII